VLYDGTHVYKAVCVLHLCRYDSAGKDVRAALAAVQSVTNSVLVKLKVIGFTQQSNISSAVLLFSQVFNASY
jgi:hypothetical protein